MVGADPPGESRDERFGTVTASLGGPGQSRWEQLPPSASAGRPGTRPAPSGGVVVTR